MGGGWVWVWARQVSTSGPTAASMMANGRTTTKTEKVKGGGGEAPV